MPWLIKLAILSVVISPTPFVSGPGRITPPQKFDEFGDIKCEDEMARLDNFALQLQSQLQTQPQAKGVIIFFGGKTFRGRLPKRGEAEARAARLKPYLVGRRGIPTDRVIVINGGYAEGWLVQLWVVPPGVSIPNPDEPARVTKVRFRKGKANPRDYRCRI